jgi:hypothetical protein
MPVSLELSSISARMLAVGIDHDIDPGQQVIASGWRFVGGGAHVLVYADRDELGSVLRLHALAAEPYPTQVRRLALAALAARADEMYGVGILTLSRSMDDDGTASWAWAAPYPAGTVLSDAFFDALFDTFVELVKDDVNAIRFTIDGGWELMDSGRTGGADDEWVGEARYVHDRTGAVLEVRLTAGAFEALPHRLLTREQITAREGVVVVLDTARR